MTGFAKESRLAGRDGFDLVFEFVERTIKVNRDAERPEAGGGRIAAFVTDDFSAHRVLRFIADDVEVERDLITDLHARAGEKQRAADAEIANDGRACAVPSLHLDFSCETREVACACATFTAWAGVH